jgi:hypothetical protein
MICWTSWPKMVKSKKTLKSLGEGNGHETKSVRTRVMIRPTRGRTKN